jgi:rhodanese-related sulfurtransferase
MEYEMARIKETDVLVPTSRFYTDIEDKLGSKKDEHLILYCHTGSRSYQVQYAMGSLGFKSIGNLTYGIVSYNGDIISGR